MTALLISVDEEKRLLPGYVPDRAEEFHRQSAKNADKAFMRALKEEPDETAILLCGGSASGKTEFYSEYLADQPGIVFDSTLPTALGAKNKLRLIRRAKKKPAVYAILPDDLRRAFSAFLGRDRRFQPEHFYKTHSGSRQTLLFLATEEPSVDIKLFESSYGPQGLLRYRPLTFENHAGLVEYLTQIQYTERQIAQLIHPL